MIDDHQIIQVTGETPSTIHHALRATRRRLVVMIIAHRSLPRIPTPTKTASEQQTTVDSGFEVSARELAREIVSIEDNIKKSQATGPSYHNAYTALTQTHLPLLDEISAIEYDANRKTVTPSQNLIPLAIIASLSSNVAKMIFHNSIAQLYTAGKSNSLNAIDD